MRLIARGIKRVLLPTENARDIKEIPATILKSIRLELVDHMDDVLRKALVLAEPDSFLRQPLRYRACRAAPIPAGGDGNAGDHHPSELARGRPTL